MQAVTVMKMVGWIVLLPPVIKFLVVVRNWPEGWTRVTLFLPTYWVYKLYEAPPSEGYGLPVAVIVHLIWISVLVIAFRRRVL